MPRIEVRSTSDGSYSRLDSSDPDIITHWLIETFDRIKPLEMCPAQVTFRPLLRPDPREPNGVADWTTDSMWHSETFLTGGSDLAAVKELANELLRFVERTEREQRKAEIEAAQARYADGHPV